MSDTPPPADRIAILRQLITPRDGAVRTPEPDYLVNKFVDYFTEYLKGLTKVPYWQPFQSIRDTMWNNFRLMPKVRSSDLGSVKSALEWLPKNPVIVPLWSSNAAVVFQFGPSLSAPQSTEMPVYATLPATTTSSSSKSWFSSSKTTDPNAPPPLTLQQVQQIANNGFVNAYVVRGYPMIYDQYVTEFIPSEISVPWVAVQAPYASVLEQSFLDQLRGHMKSVYGTYSTKRDKNDPFMMVDPGTVSDYLLGILTDVSHLDCPAFYKKVNVKWTDNSDFMCWWARTQKSTVWVLIKNILHMLCRFEHIGPLAIETGDLIYKSIILSFTCFTLEKSRDHYTLHFHYIKECLVAVTKRADKLNSMADAVNAKLKQPVAADSIVPHAIYLAKMLVQAASEQVQSTRSALDEIWNQELEAIARKSDVSKYIDILCATTSRWFFQASDTAFPTGSVMSTLGGLKDATEKKSTGTTETWLMHSLKKPLGETLKDLKLLITEPPDQLKNLPRFRELTVNLILDYLLLVSSEKSWKKMTKTMNHDEALKALENASKLFVKYLTFIRDVERDYVSGWTDRIRLYRSKSSLGAHLIFVMILKLAPLADEAGILAEHCLVWVDTSAFQHMWLESGPQMKALAYIERYFDSVKGLWDAGDNLFATHPKSIAKAWAKHYDAEGAKFSDVQIPVPPMPEDGTALTKEEKEQRDFANRANYSLLLKERARDDQKEATVAKMYAAQRKRCLHLKQIMEHIQTDREAEDDRIRDIIAKEEAAHALSRSTREFKASVKVPPHDGDCRCSFCKKLKPMNKEYLAIQAVQPYLKTLPESKSAAYVALFARFHINHPIFKFLIESIDRYYATYMGVPHGATTNKVVVQLWNWHTIKNPNDQDYIIASLSSKKQKNANKLQERPSIILGSSQNLPTFGAIDVVYETNPVYGYYPPPSMDMFFAFHESHTAVTCYTSTLANLLCYDGHRVNNFAWMFDVNPANENRAIATYASQCLPTMRQSEYIMLGSLRAGGTLQIPRLRSMLDGPKISLHQREANDVMVELLVQACLYQVGPSSSSISYDNLMSNSVIPASATPAAPVAPGPNPTVTPAAIPAPPPVELAKIAPNPSIPPAPPHPNALRASQGLRVSAQGNTIITRPGEPTAPSSSSGATSSGATTSNANASSSSSQPPALKPGDPIPDPDVIAASGKGFRMWKRCLEDPSFVSSIAVALSTSFDSLKELAQAHNYRILITFLVYVANTVDDETYKLFVPIVVETIAKIHTKLMELHQEAQLKTEDGRDQSVPRLHQQIRELACAAITLFDTPDESRRGGRALTQSLSSLVFFMTLTCHYVPSTRVASSRPSRGSELAEAKVPLIMYQFLPLLTSAIDGDSYFIPKALPGLIPQGTYAPWKNEGVGTYTSMVTPVGNLPPFQVTFQAMTGEILLSGNTARRLPAFLTNFESYRRVFESTLFTANSANSEGYYVPIPSADCITPVAGAPAILPSQKPSVQMRFSSKGSDLNCVEIRTYPDGRIQKLQLIPHYMVSFIDADMRDEFSHWADLETKTVYFRPVLFTDRDFFKLDKCPYIINLKTRELLTTSSTNFPNYKLTVHTGKIWGAAHKLFSRLDTHVRVWVSPSDTTLVELPKMQLHFYPDDSRTRLLCQEHSGYAVERVQYCGVLVGLMSYILLYHANHPELYDRKMIVPHYPLTTLNVNPVHHRCHLIPIGSALEEIGTPAWFVFTLDSSLKQLRAASPSVDLFLAHLHVHTSGSLPEPFTGLTGIESAILCLRRYPTNTALDPISQQSLASIIITVPRMSSGYKNANIVIGTQNSPIFYEGLAPIVMKLAKTRTQFASQMSSLGKLHAYDNSSGNNQNINSNLKKRPLKNGDRSRKRSKLKASIGGRRNVQPDEDSDSDMETDDAPVQGCNGGLVGFMRNIRSADYDYNEYNQNNANDEYGLKSSYVSELIGGWTYMKLFWLRNKHLYPPHMWPTEEEWNAVNSWSPQTEMWFNQSPILHSPLQYTFTQLQGVRNICYYARHPAEALLPLSGSITRYFIDVNFDAMFYKRMDRTIYHWRLEYVPSPCKVFDFLYNNMRNGWDMFPRESFPALIAYLWLAKNDDKMRGDPWIWLLVALSALPPNQLPPLPRRSPGNVHDPPDKVLSPLGEKSTAPLVKPKKAREESHETYTNRCYVYTSKRVNDVFINTRRLKSYFEHDANHRLIVPKQPGPCPSKAEIEAEMINVNPSNDWYGRFVAYWNAKNEDYNYIATLEKLQTLVPTGSNPVLKGRLISPVLGSKSPNMPGAYDEYYDQQYAALDAAGISSGAKRNEIYHALELTTPYPPPPVLPTYSSTNDTLTALVASATNLVSENRHKKFEKKMANLFTSNGSSKKDKAQKTKYSATEDILDNTGDVFNTGVGKAFLGNLQASMAALKAKAIDEEMVLPDNIRDTLTKWATDSKEEANKYWEAMTMDHSNDPLTIMRKASGIIQPRVPMVLIDTIVLQHIDETKKSLKEQQSQHDAAASNAANNDDERVDGDVDADTSKSSGKKDKKGKGKKGKGDQNDKEGQTVTLTTSQAYLPVLEAYMLMQVYLRKFITCLEMVTPDLLKHQTINPRHPLYLELKTRHASGWTIAEYPEWLLLELEQGFMIREIQAEVAHAMVDNPSLHILRVDEDPTDDDQVILKELDRMEEIRAEEEELENEKKRIIAEKKAQEEADRKEAERLQNELNGVPNTPPVDASSSGSNSSTANNTNNTIATTSTTTTSPIQQQSNAMPNQTPNTSYTGHLPGYDSDTASSSDGDPQNPEIPRPDKPKLIKQRKGHVTKAGQALAKGGTTGGMESSSDDSDSEHEDESLSVSKSDGNNKNDDKEKEKENNKKEDEAKSSSSSNPPSEPSNQDPATLSSSSSSTTTNDPSSSSASVSTTSTLGSSSSDANIMKTRAGLKTARKPTPTEDQLIQAAKEKADQEQQLKESREKIMAEQKDATKKAAQATLNKAKSDQERAAAESAQQANLFSTYKDSSIKNYSGRCLQLNMGEGKTSVILPAICMTLGSTKVLPRVISIPSQLTTMNSALVMKLGGLLRRPVYVFPFTRDTPLSGNMLRAMSAQLDTCLNLGGVILASPEHILAFQLKYELIIAELTAKNNPARPNKSNRSKLGVMVAPDPIPPVQATPTPPTPTHPNQTMPLHAWSNTNPVPPPVNNANAANPNNAQKGVGFVSEEMYTRELIAIASEMEKIKAFWACNVMELLDESDELLRHKFQLVYPIGNQQDVNGSSKRWLVNEGVLHILQMIAPAIASSSNVDKDVAPSVEYLPHQRQEAWSQFVVHSDSCHSTLTGKIAEAILDGIGPGWAFNNFHLRALRSNDRGLALSYLLDPNVEVSWDIIENLETRQSQLIKSAFGTDLDTLFILRGLLCHDILTHILTLRHSVDYGIRKAKKSKDGKVSKQVDSAVPYRAKDTASERSEFEHVDVMIMCTLISYYHVGLNYNQFISTINHLVTINDPVTKQQVYEEWLSMYVDHNTGVASPDAPAIRSSDSIDIADDNMMRSLYSKLYMNRAVINFWLNKVVFPRETKQFPYKLCAASPDIVPSKKYRASGFSGTNDTQDLLPCSVIQRDVPILAHTNATAINLVVQQAKSLAKQLRDPSLPPIIISKQNPDSPASPDLSSTGIASASTPDLLKGLTSSPALGDHVRSSLSALSLAGTSTGDASSKSSPKPANLSSGTSTPSALSPGKSGRERKKSQPPPVSVSSSNDSVVDMNSSNDAVGGIVPPKKRTKKPKPSSSNAMDSDATGDDSNPGVSHTSPSSSTASPQPVVVLVDKDNLKSAGAVKEGKQGKKSKKSDVSSSSGIHGGCMNNDGEVHCLPAGLTGRQILEELFSCRHLDKSGRDPRALIDSGALIVGLSNAEVAKYLLLILPPHTFDGVVYFQGDSLMALDRQLTSMEFNLSPFVSNMSRVFVYLDDHHTRGTDIKMPLLTHAWVTLGPMMNKDKFLQACARLRQMGAGQTACFVAPPQVYGQLQQVALDPNHVGIREVILWTCSNSLLALQRALPVWAEQNFRHIRNSLMELGMEDPDLYIALCAIEEKHDLGAMYGVSRHEGIGSVVMINWLESQILKIEEALRHAGQMALSKDKSLVRIKEMRLRAAPIKARCRKLLKDFKLMWSGNLAHSEQEREVEHEVEQESDKNKNKFDLLPVTERILNAGIIDLARGKRVKFDSIKSSTKALTHSLPGWKLEDYNQSIGWDPRLRCTESFLKCVSNPHVMETGSPTLRPPGFIVFWYSSDGSNSANASDLTLAYPELIEAKRRREQEREEQRRLKAAEEERLALEAAAKRKAAAAAAAELAVDSAEEAADIAAAIAASEKDKAEEDKRNQSSSSSSTTTTKDPSPDSKNDTISSSSSTPAPASSDTTPSTSAPAQSATSSSSTPDVTAATSTASKSKNNKKDVHIKTAAEIEEQEELELIAQAHAKPQHKLIMAVWISAVEAEIFYNLVLPKCPPGIAFVHTSPRIRTSDQELLYMPLRSNLNLIPEDHLFYMSQLSLFSGSLFFSFDKKGEMGFASQRPHVPSLPPSIDMKLGLQQFLGILMVPGANDAEGRKEWKLLQEHNFISVSGFINRPMFIDYSEGRMPKFDFITEKTWKLMEAIMKYTKCELDPGPWVPQLCALRGARHLGNSDLISLAM